jgi:hypothetical protein
MTIRHCVVTFGRKETRPSSLEPPKMEDKPWQTHLAIEPIPGSFEAGIYWSMGKSKPTAASMLSKCWKIIETMAVLGEFSGGTPLQSQHPWSCTYPCNQKLIGFVGLGFRSWEKNCTSRLNPWNVYMSMCLSNLLCTDAMYLHHYVCKYTPITTRFF